MNIFVSYNWLKEYLKTDLAPEEFASRVSLCGPSVERINYQGADLDKIVVGKILKVEKHPNADKLRIVEIDIGGKKLRVVCGGSNLAPKMKVAVALSGAKVKWHGEGELVELKPTEIRGVKSEGMICAAEEIGLDGEFPKKDEKEILDLSNFDAKPGTPLVDALNLKDVIFDIEVTTNRPDMMSVVGIAREAGTILKSPFSPPKIAPLKSGTGVSLKVKNNEPDLCYRYQAVAIDGVKVKESPWWLKQKLASVGCRSINNIVDATNLVLWEMGQPLHAFDYEKLFGKSIIVRQAKKGEKIKALDGNEYKLKEDNLVIADAKHPVAVAGVMGGEESGVTYGTKTIVLEAATFNPVSVRRTSRALNLRSDSSNLFEKGLSTEATSPALLRAAALIIELAGGKIASKVFDARSKKFSPPIVALSVSKANNIMGLSSVASAKDGAELKAEEMADILSRLGFSVKAAGDIIKSKPPYWREGDIEIEEDLIEEVARVYGYHRLPSALPSGATPSGGADKIFYWEHLARELAAAAGYDEILSYSMVSQKMMEAAGESKAVKIANPLSADLEYMRTCLLPGLLQAAAENEKNFPQAKIFELSRVYAPTSSLSFSRKRESSTLPKEESHFSGLLWTSSAIPAKAGIQSPERELFYQAKGFAEKFLEKFGISGYEIKDSDDKNFHPARSLDVYVGKDYLGSFGEIHPATLANFGLSGRVGFFYFYFDEVASYAKIHKSYSPIPEFPGVKRDISFVADECLEYEKIKEALVAADPLVAEIGVFDVYEGKGIAEGKKSMALHILFRSEHRTLEALEADTAFQKLVNVLKDKFHAEIRM